ncbi:radical SAM protein [bacterium]|nr:radical SAM protein [candidate division CSSED10-310 bacterium]
MRPLAAASLAREFWRIKWHSARAPLFVGYAITNRCNRNCAYCDKSVVVGEELTTLEMTAMVDQLAAAGTRFMTVTGGEPLLRDDLGVLLECCRRHGIRVNVNTNGDLLPERRELIGKAASFTLSLDGGESSDAVRGENGRANVLTAADLISAAGGRVLFATVIHARNVDRLREMVEVAERYRTIVTYQPISLYYDGAQGVPLALLPDRRRLREALEDLSADRRAMRFIGNSRAGLRYLMNWPGDTPTFCRIWKLFCRIEPDGMLFSCGRQYLTPLKYDIRRYGVAEAFRRLHRPRVCKGCWCGSALELNLLMDFDPHAVTAALRRLI